MVPCRSFFTALWALWLGLGLVNAHLQGRVPYTGRMRASMARPGAQRALEISLDDLNPSQRAAVSAPLHQHTRVIAGPGSGKTRVLVRRIAYLVQQGESAHSVLAVTFTKKAAEEMKQRLRVLVGPDRAARVTVMTLHAFCSMVLRRYGDAATRNYSIFDDADSRKLVRRILEEEFGDKDTSPSQVMSAVSNLKRAGLTNRQTLLFKGSNEQYELACKVLPLYQSTLRANNAKDFEDLIGDALCLVTSGAQGMGGAAASGDSSSSSSSSDFTDLASRYRHILVDEWQDVDSSQYNLLVAMSRCASDHAAVNGAGAAGTAGAASLFVVGDSMQTIYRNFFKFSQEFTPPLQAEAEAVSTVAAVAAGDAGFQELVMSAPTPAPAQPVPTGPKTFILNENYRSTAGIISAAAGLVKRGGMDTGEDFGGGGVAAVTSVDAAIALGDGVTVTEPVKVPTTMITCTKIPIS